MYTRLLLLVITTWAILAQMLAERDVGTMIGREGTVGAKIRVITTIVGVSTDLGPVVNAIAVIVMATVTDVAEKGNLLTH